MIRLGVNIDHVATLREARKEKYPEPIEAALIAESAGADGITVHLRMDRRHIKERDVRLLKEVVKTHLNVECSLDRGIQDFINEVKPHWVCLVPERPEEITTEGGLDLRKVFNDVRSAIERLKSNNINVTIFVEPDIEIPSLALDAGADAIEINTGGYADKGDLEILKNIEKVARKASSLGLEVHAGHGLNLRNVGEIARIHEIVELNIGHAIVSRAVIVGMHEAVREMKEAILISRGE